MIYVFLCLAVFTSQFSIASSSIGIGGLIILTSFKLIYRSEKIFIEKNLLYFFGLFIIMQVVSSVFSSNPGESFENISRKISLYIIFFASILFIKKEADLLMLLKILILFTALVSAVEIIRFAVDYLPNPDKPLSEYRLQYYGYPVTNGEIKMILLLIIIPFLLVKKKFLFSKSILILLSLPLFITFYLTNTRNAILGLFTGLIITGSLKNRYFLAGLIVIVVLFLLFAPIAYKERVFSIADPEHPSNKSRIVMWETGIKMFKDNPVLGVGDIDINKVYRMYKTPESHGEGSHMHNNFMQMLVNFGSLGLISWLILMLYIFFRQVKIYSASKQHELLNLISLISVTSFTALMITGLTEYNFGDAEFAAVFWFALSLAFLAEKFKLNGGKV